MTIENFKTLAHEQKLLEVRHNGNILGTYDRPNESGGSKTAGDIYEVHDFWVYISEDEETVIPSRRNPIAEKD